MTTLSVNINKFATIRNARGANNPDLLKVAADCQEFGAQGITVHPRPDERHIRYQDVRDLAPLVTTEFNVEGRPDPRFMQLVLEVKPAQCTLVPDALEALTSNSGWDTVHNASLLKEIISELKKQGIRTSVFVDPVARMIEGAAAAGADRIELFTEPYAVGFKKDRAAAIAPYKQAASYAVSLGMGVNAGHDLDLENLGYFYREIPELLEVSIGHALVCDAIYLGLENTIRMYRNQLISL